MEHERQSAPEAAAPGPPTGPTGTRAVHPAAALVLALLLLTGAAAATLRFVQGDRRARPADVDLSVPDWRPDAVEQRRLAEVAAARRAAAPALDDPEVKGLLDAYARFCAVELRTAGDTRSPELADAHADFEQWALTSLRFLGSERYMGLGQVLADRVLAAVQARDRATVEALAGHLVHHLQSTNLVEADLSPRPGTELVVPAIFMARWAQVVRESRPPDTLLSAEERKILLRWKLAANPLVSAERREEVARALSALDPGFPIMRALAARAADERQWAEAARYYAAALQEAPDDGTLRANLELARAQANAQSQRPPAP
ncbi:MAG: hypothetical protein H6746_06800 [Deltaproteobacteria bacterium]|nr:hypothetical protein [Deltaproteobacteria bacterium]